MICSRFDKISKTLLSDSLTHSLSKMDPRDAGASKKEMLADHCWGFPTKSKSTCSSPLLNIIRGGGGPFDGPPFVAVSNSIPNLVQVEWEEALNRDLEREQTEVHSILKLVHLKRNPGKY